MTEFQPKILIVEDEPDISSTLQSYLGRRGFQVSTTASGCEALSFIDISHPDIVILDFALSDLNGRDVLRQLRQTDQRTQVIVITGQMLSDEEIEKVKALGIAEYFHKPIILERLGQVIGRLTGRDLKFSPVGQAPAADIFSSQKRALPQKDAHKLINLLGIIRNKCENFTLNRDAGIYKDKTETELIGMASELLEEIPLVIDSALDVIDHMKKEK